MKNHIIKSVPYATILRLKLVGWFSFVCVRSGERLVMVGIVEAHSLWLECATLACRIEVASLFKKRGRMNSLVAYVLRVFSPLFLRLTLQRLLCDKLNMQSFCCMIVVAWGVLTNVNYIERASTFACVKK